MSKKLYCTIMIIFAILAITMIFIVMLVVRHQQIYNENILAGKEAVLTQNFNNVYTFEDYEISPHETGFQVTLNVGNISVNYFFDKDYNFVGSENNYLPLWNNAIFALIFIPISILIVLLVLLGIIKRRD